MKILQKTPHNLMQNFILYPNVTLKIFIAKLIWHFPLYSFLKLTLVRTEGHYQFFPCNIYKHMNESPKSLEF